MLWSHLTGSSTEDDLLPVGLNPPVPLLDVLGHMSPDDLQAGTLAVAPDTSTLAALQDLPGTRFGVIRELRGVEERGVGDDGQDLSDEGDGRVPHRVGVANVGLDHRAERLLDPILDFLTENIFYCSESQSVL